MILSSKLSYMHLLKSCVSHCRLNLMRVFSIPSLVTSSLYLSTVKTILVLFTFGSEGGVTQRRHESLKKSPTICMMWVQVQIRFIILQPGCTALFNHEISYFCFVFQETHTIQIICEGEEPENFFWIGIGGRKKYDKVRNAIYTCEFCV